jgi:hypothetical protein
VWLPRVPADATIIAVETVGPADRLGRATGRPVLDITSTTPPAWTARAVQIPERVTAGRRPGPLVALIRGHLARHPGERLGVLLPGNKEKVAALQRAIRPLWRPGEGQRVALGGWFGKGTPAGDRLLALGVPAVPPRSVRRRLAQRGLEDAAVGEGEWGEVPWTGRRQSDGAAQEVRGWGYREPDWHQAYRDAVLDRMRRRLAGVGVPVVVMADLELGLGLVEGPVPLDELDVKLLEGLR